MISFNPEEYSDFTEKNKKEGRPQKALQALRIIGISSATEGKEQSWAFREKENEIEIHPWGAPTDNDENIARFKVVFSNEAQEASVVMITFERAVKEKGEYAPKVFLVSELKTGSNSPKLWHSVNIKNMGDIKNVGFVLDKDKNINEIRADFKEPPEGMTEKNFHVSIDQLHMGLEDMEEREKILGIVNKSLNLGDKPIGVNNLDPAVLLNKCLDKSRPIDNNLIKPAISS